MKTEVSSSKVHSAFAFPSPVFYLACVCRAALCSPANNPAVHTGPRSARGTKNKEKCKLMLVVVQVVQTFAFKLGMAEVDFFTKS